MPMVKRTSCTSSVMGSKLFLVFLSSFIIGMHVLLASPLVACKRKSYRLWTWKKTLKERGKGLRNGCTGRVSDEHKEQMYFGFGD